MLNDTQLTADPVERHLLLLARQEIEQLRRWYAVATDALGKTDDADARSRGLAIYHRIFAPDAEMSVHGSPTALAGIGPDAWAEVAANALAGYAATQHLIGSQVVTFESVSFGGEPRRVLGGRAEMSSYLQAWHAWPDQRLRLVMGTYEDAVRYEPSIGWQIEKMVLVYVGGEIRDLGDPL